MAQTELYRGGVELADRPGEVDPGVIVDIELATPEAPINTGAILLELAKEFDLTDSSAAGEHDYLFINGELHSVKTDETGQKRLAPQSEDLQGDALSQYMEAMAALSQGETTHKIEARWEPSDTDGQEAYTIITYELQENGRVNVSHNLELRDHQKTTEDPSHSGDGESPKTATEQINQSDPNPWSSAAEPSATPSQAQPSPRKWWQQQPEPKPNKSVVITKDLHTQGISESAPPPLDKPEPAISSTEPDVEPTTPTREQPALTVPKPEASDPQRTPMEPTTPKDSPEPTGGRPITPETTTILTAIPETAPVKAVPEQSLSKPKTESAPEKPLEQAKTEVKPAQSKPEANLVATEANITPPRAAESTATPENILVNPAAQEVTASPPEVKTTTTEIPVRTTLHEGTTISLRQAPKPVQILKSPSLQANETIQPLEPAPAVAVQENKQTTHLSVETPTSALPETAEIPAAEQSVETVKTMDDQAVEVSAEIDIPAKQAAHQPANAPRTYTQAKASEKITPIEPAAHESPAATERITKTPLQQAITAPPTTIAAPVAATHIGYVSHEILDDEIKISTAMDEPAENTHQRVRNLKTHRTISSQTNPPQPSVRTITPTPTAQKRVTHETLTVQEPPRKARITVEQIAQAEANNWSPPAEQVTHIAPEATVFETPSSVDAPVKTVQPESIIQSAPATHPQETHPVSQMLSAHDNVRPTIHKPLKATDVQIQPVTEQTQKPTTESLEPAVSARPVLTPQLKRWADDFGADEPVSAEAPEPWHYEPVAPVFNAESFSRPTYAVSPFTMQASTANDINISFDETERRHTARRSAKTRTAAS